jgi:hypothetical protein
MLTFADGISRRAGHQNHVGSKGKSCEIAERKIFEKLTKAKIQRRNYMRSKLGAVKLPTVLVTEPP